MKVCVAPGVSKPVTLNGTVDDLFRQIEGQEIRNHRDRHDDTESISAAVACSTRYSVLDFFPWVTVRCEFSWNFKSLKRLKSTWTNSMIESSQAYSIQAREGYMTWGRKLRCQLAGVGIWACDRSPRDAVLRCATRAVPTPQPCARRRSDQAYVTMALAAPTRPQGHCRECRR